MDTACAIILTDEVCTESKPELPESMSENMSTPTVSRITDLLKNAGIDNIIIATKKNKEIYNRIFDRRLTGRNFLVIGSYTPILAPETIRDSLNFHISGSFSQTLISVNTTCFQEEKSSDGVSGGGMTENISEASQQDSFNSFGAVFSGAVWMRHDTLSKLLTDAENNPSKGSFVSCDILSQTLSQKKKIGIFASNDLPPVAGADTRSSMSNEERRRDILEGFISAGVSIPCTDGIIIDKNTLIGKDTVILPGTIIKEGCRIGRCCTIGPNTVLYKTAVGDHSTLNCVQSEEATVGNNVSCGPFVHIRPGSIIKNGVHCGNFVEIKNSEIGEKTKIPHLTYVGDSDVGSSVNFGCGAVTVNFNGKEKNRCKIGDAAFIGCNTNLIAPVSIGDRAYTAAGSTITEDVPSDTLAIARERQTNKENWVKTKKPYR